MRLRRLDRPVLVGVVFLLAILGGGAVRARETPGDLAETALVLAFDSSQSPVAQGIQGAAGAPPKSDDSKRGRPARAPEGAVRDGSHDFDFLLGSWKTHFRVLMTRLAGASDWVDYDGTQEFRKMFDTNATVDEFDAYSSALHMRNHGRSFRLYNIKTRQWTIYHLNNEGALDAPVVGEFVGNRGEFYGQDTANERSIYVRNVWQSLTPTSARWEQAWSADGGRTWEVNWTADFARSSGAP
jgi:hypothetical protein